MRINYLLLLTLMCTLGGLISAQEPPRPPGPPQGQGPRFEWTRFADTDKNGSVDASEFQAAIDRSFAEFDKNGNGVIEQSELRGPARGEMGRGMGPDGGPPERRQGPPPGQAGGAPGFGRGVQGPPSPPEAGAQGAPGMGARHPGMEQGRPGAPMAGSAQAGIMGRGGVQGPPPEEARLLPPMFFMDLFKDGGTPSKSDFERRAKEVFNELDTNKDGVLNPEETKPRRGPGEGGPPPPPNAQFIGAELRFGDKLIKNQPFSADMVIEDTRRLFDGTTVTKKMNGAIFRDSAGRTRREQPLEMIGGVTLLGADNKPQRLIFINDFSNNSQIFIDPNNKIAHKNRIQADGRRQEPGTPPNSKTESLGSKTIEGIKAEGTRISFEIPAGELGNDKPIPVYTETWFSPELQIMVMSRHTDPIAGEHVFKLVNIKRSEPANDLFAVPAGFRVENPPERPAVRQ